ncbi:MAG: hypothetical protein HGA47_01705 [Zoogloea sp.]|nr:hypothetical protein [Zoogloea sp.]
MLVDTESSMRTLFGVCFMVLALQGCSSGVNAASTASSRAKLLSEIIENRADCGVFQDRLGAASVDLSAVDSVYRAAQKNGCLKRNI